MSLETQDILSKKLFKTEQNALVHSPGPTPTILLLTPTIPTKLIMIKGKLARFINQNNVM